MFVQTVWGLGRVGLAGCALITVLTLRPALAGAVTDDERAGARAAAEEGARAFNERRFADAVDFFTRAESLVHSPVHLLFLARSRAELGQLVEARESYLKVTRESVTPESPAAFLKAQQDAQAELRKLEPRLAYISVSVQGRSPNEVTVKMDGAVVPPALVGVPRPVNPGEHSFQAHATGMESSVSKVTVKEGGRETIVLTLEEAAGQPAGDAAAPEAGGQAPAGGMAAPGAGSSTGAPQDGGVEAPSDNSWMRPASYAGFGVGVLGVGAGVYFLMQKGSKQDDADALYGDFQQNCTNGGSSPDCASLEDQITQLDDDAGSAGTLSTVSFIVGGVGLGAGVALFLLSGDDGGQAAPAAARAPRVTPYVGYRSVGLVGTF